MQKLLIYIVAIVCLSACVDDEVGTFVPSQITATSNAKDGSFSLGRVLAGNGTSTKTLMLYNKGDKAVEFDSLVLRRAKYFRINVDGMGDAAYNVTGAGQHYTDPAFLHIQKGDSMYILVDGIFPLHEGNNPLVYRDTIDIYSAGLTRQIALSATALPVQQLRDSVITTDVIWSGAEAARQVFGQLTIAKGATLSIIDSMTVYMHLGSGIVVDGTLNINGHSYSQPVTLCGDRLDSLFVNLAYRDMPSQWGGIVNRGSIVADNARVLGMTDGVRTAENSTLDCTACVLSNSDSILFNARKANVSLTNCLLSNGAMGLFRAEDSNVNLTYCTFANYCYWYATTRPDVELVITPQNNQAATPVAACILNTLIYGRWVNPSIQINEEVKFSPEIGERFNIRMDSCRYDINPSYVLDDRKNYFLDAHVADSSVCLKSALPVPGILFDLEGTPRDPHHPTIGCFE